MFDEKGVMEIPSEYTVILIVAFIGISVISAISYDAWREYEIKKCIGEIKRIVNEAEKLCKIGEEGTNITFEAYVPEEVKKVVFDSNCYYIIMKWGENLTFHTEAKFEHSILYGGRREIKIEIMEGGYVKIYG